MKGKKGMSDSDKDIFERIIRFEALRRAERAAEPEEEYDTDVEEWVVPPRNPDDEK